MPSEASSRDELDELLHRARQHADGKLGTEQWIDATEPITKENP